MVDPGLIVLICWLAREQCAQRGKVSGGVNKDRDGRQQEQRASTAATICTAQCLYRISVIARSEFKDLNNKPSCFTAEVPNHRAHALSPLLCTWLFLPPIATIILWVTTETAVCLCVCEQTHTGKKLPTGPQAPKKKLLWAMEQKG